MNTRNSSMELSGELTGHIEALARETGAARVSETRVAYLEMCAMFHKYSPQNVWLIMMACPHATHVAGYRRW